MTAAEPNCINVGCSHEAFLDPSQIWRVFTDASHELCAAWKRCIVCFQIISKQQNEHKGPACFKGWQRSLCTWSNQAQNSLSRAQTETALSLSLSHTCSFIIKPPKQRLDRHPVRGDGSSPRATCAHTSSKDAYKMEKTNGLVLNGNPIPPWFFFNTVPLIGSVHRLPPHSIR